MNHSYHTRRKKVGRPSKESGFLRFTVEIQNGRYTMSHKFQFKFPFCCPINCNSAGRSGEFGNNGYHLVCFEIASNAVIHIISVKTKYWSNWKLKNVDCLVVCMRMLLFIRHKNKWMLNEKEWLFSRRVSTKSS